MELCEFAERVLFATTLEEKLQCPAYLTDERPGLPVVTPVAPGRPPELRFKEARGAKADFPGLQRLDNERERGRVLHFFANHELLAIELMALVLLRFPNAPAAFRRGVLQTLQDEQGHTQLYLQRMRECGVRFGEIPVSGYFWRAISGMENPMDYVAGLSLTLEQANLDFTKQYERAFAALGDTRTEALLKKICRDEVGHVAAGLKWFRQWKNPSESDWEAFCNQLKFPLSAQRAKGPVLNVEARRAAGLDSEFIDELNVYSRSKGRTPGVFVFNPFAEAYLAQGRSFAPVKAQALLARDLESLPQFLCRQDDVVLVEQRPSVAFLSSLKSAGFWLPEFVELGLNDPAKAHDEQARETHRKVMLNQLAKRKLGALRPWAWAPDSEELLAPLRGSLTATRNTESPQWQPTWFDLYSKTWSAEFLRRVLTKCPSESWLCEEREVGMAARSLEEALAVVEQIRSHGHHKVVVKEAVGLAGHNAIRLWEPQILEAQRRWIQNAVQNGRRVVVEPWMEREIDFSIQLEMTSSGLKVCGYTGLMNDRKGQYQGNWAAPNYERRIPAPVTAVFHGLRDAPDRLAGFYAPLLTDLGEELRVASYLGPVSVDAFVYRNAHGECRLKPIVEINPRFTMGRVTVELMKHAAPGTHGLFRLVSRAMTAAEGYADFVAYGQALTERFPVQLEGDTVPRIRRGALCLTDPARAQQYLATFQVSRSADDLRTSGGVQDLKSYTSQMAMACLNEVSGSRRGTNS